MALTTTLESLPFDTIVVIARHLPEARDLANLAAVSRGLWAACEEHAQREVRLLLGRAAVSLAVGGQVASWVHELAFFRACLAGRTVAAGSYTSLVLDTRQQQQLFTCGSGKLGQLGRGEAEDMDQCGAVDMAGAGASAPIVKIDAGCAHTAVLLGDGRVATFGDARYHQLGHGENRIQPVPRLLGGALAGEHVVDVACGSSHTVFVTRSGSVYGCGTGFNGQLGFGRETEGSRLPMLMRGLEGVHVVRAACGLIHTVLLTSQGSVYTCGSNGHGQLGLGLDLSIEVWQPRLVASLAAAAQPMVQVACGSLMTMLLTARGRVFVCGGGEPGVLGLPGITEAREPVELRVPSGLRVVHMAAGHDLTVLVDEQGNAFYCGGFRGRRIDGSRPAVTVAHSPTALASRAQLGRVTQAAAGNAHALLRTTRGLYAFGGNARGQLGRPADRTLFLPDPVPLPLSPVS